MSALLAAALGAGAGYYARKHTAEQAIGSAEAEAKRRLDEAEAKIESKQKDALTETRNEIKRLRADNEREAKERRNELNRAEKRLASKEEALERKLASAEKHEQSLTAKDAELEAERAGLAELKAQQSAELERVSGLTAEEAKSQLLAELDSELELDKARLVSQAEQDIKDESERRARNLVSMAIQRCASEQVSETAISVVTLPSDEMKGRIIGREGRNIRALETATGINLIIDDTPEAVILSGFDQVRREIARQALETLVSDGRIHPARIEEVVARATRDMEREIKDSGESAAIELGINGLHPELAKLLGRLKYRTSYGQNVLQHSIEVAMLAGNLAAELGADATLAKRAGLLHDIGKAVERTPDGSHVQVGVDTARKYRESEAVVNAIAAHHGDAEPASVEAVLVAAADAISAARPGARRENLDAYLTRLTRLEELAQSFPGVETCYAVQAGRELRVIVKPEEVSDAGAVLLARELTKRIESELTYPGQIRTTVIRETRAVEYAK